MAWSTLTVWAMLVMWMRVRMVIEYSGLFPLKPRPQRILLVQEPGLVPGSLSNQVPHSSTPAPPSYQGHTDP